MDIKHNAGQRRFEIEVDGYKAHVAYSIHDNGLDIRHTIVPSEIGGRGIASALVKAAYDFALKCPEAHSYLFVRCNMVAASSGVSRGNK